MDNLIIDTLMKYYYSFECTPEGADAMFAQFMSGMIPDTMLNNFLKLINRLSSGNPDNWEICFVPSAKEAETQRLFSPLADKLAAETGIKTNMSTLSRGNSSNADVASAPAFRCDSGAVSGKNIILIDSLVSRGRTINSAASALYDAGALSVTGLVVAKEVAA